MYFSKGQRDGTKRPEKGGWEWLERAAPKTREQGPKGSKGTVAKRGEKPEATKCGAGRGKGLRGNGGKH